MGRINKNRKVELTESELKSEIEGLEGQLKKLTESKKSKHINDRVIALSEFLNVPVTEILQSKYNDNSFEVDGKEYLVLTDDEADDEAKASIVSLVEDVGYGDLSKIDVKIEESWFRDAIKGIAGNWRRDYRTASAWFRDFSGQDEFDRVLAEYNLVDMDDYVETLIDADGRGRWLAGYDFEEEKQGNFFIYRNN